jgi:hypothetical protein
MSDTTEQTTPLKTQEDWEAVAEEVAAKYREHNG